MVQKVTLLSTSFLIKRHDNGVSNAQDRIEFTVVLRNKISDF